MGSTETLSSESGVLFALVAPLELEGILNPPLFLLERGRERLAPLEVGETRLKFINGPLVTVAFAEVSHKASGVSERQVGNRRSADIELVDEDVR